MALFFASIFGGVALGGIYALTTLGLVLGYRATETFNFAHGQIMLLGAYIVARWMGAGVSWWIALFGGMCITGIVGVLFYLLVLRRTVGMPLFMPVIATLGLAAVLDGIMGIVFGPQAYSFTIPGMPEGAFRLFGAGISKERLVLTAVTLCLAAGIAIFLNHTRAGAMIRASGQDPVLASQAGINVRLMHLGSWAAVGVLAGVAGICYGSTSLVGYEIVSLGLLALPAMLLGGLDSIGGAVIGGTVIGILQGFAATYLGGDWINVVTYLALPAVIMLRPQGLFGTQQIARV